MAAEQRAGSGTSGAGNSGSGGSSSGRSDGTSGPGGTPESRRASVPRGAVITAWLVVACLGYGALGAWLCRLVEGLDRSQLPGWPLPCTALAALLALALTFAWARGDRAPAAGSPIAAGRRAFLGRALGIGASGLAGTGLATAARSRLIAGKHCFAHCGACLPACPEQLAIHDVLRFRRYFEDYREQKEAMRFYRELPKQADVCIGCSAPCVGSCPHGVPIQERAIGARRLLA